MTLFMAFLNALNWILQPILNLVAWLGSTGNWYYIFVAGFILWAIFRYGGRLRFYLFLAGAGIFVVLIGFALLCSLTPSGIHSVGDFFLFILLLIAFIAIIFLGGKIIRFLPERQGGSGLMSVGSIASMTHGIPEMIVGKYRIRRNTFIYGF